MATTNFSGPVNSANGFTVNDVSVIGSTGELANVAYAETVSRDTGTFTVTSAELLALFATPISVVAAPGANKAITPFLWIAFKPAGTAYAGIAAGEDLVLRYTDASGTIVSGIETTGFLDQATAQTRYALVPQSAVGTARVELNPTANAALMVHMTAGEIITGNTGLLIRVFYRVLPTVLS